MGQGDAFDANPYEAPRADMRREFEPRAIEPGPPVVRLEVIGQAWDLLKSQLWTWVLIDLVMLACTYAFSLAASLAAVMIQGAVQASRPGRTTLIAVVVVTQLIVFAVNLLVNAFFVGGLFRVAIKQVRGGRIEVSDLFGARELLPSLIGATLLIALAVFGGLLLLIVPALLVAGRLMFTIPLVVDRRLGAVEAFGRSWSSLSGQTLMAALLNVVAGLLAGLGALACGFGMLFTLPIYYLSIAILYGDFFRSEADSFIRPEDLMA